MESCRYTSIHVRTVHKHIVKREKFMFDIIKQEIAIIRDRDPAIKSDMEVFLYPSFKAILKYRKAHKLYLKKHYFLARLVSQRAARRTGIEIQGRYITRRLRLS